MIRRKCLVKASIGNGENEVKIGESENGVMAS
jgi:hypothetical protein